MKKKYISFLVVLLLIFCSSASAFAANSPFVHYVPSNNSLVKSTSNYYLDSSDVERRVGRDSVGSLGYYAWGWTNVKDSSTDQEVRHWTQTKLKQGSSTLISSSKIWGTGSFEVETDVISYSYSNSVAHVYYGW